VQYDDNTFWDGWLQAWPTLRAFWAALIIVLAAIYALCTVSFGLRFSNLTHRGIITGGPYRFSKHPAYLAKNLSWWLISVPFVSEQGLSAALRNCCLLGLLNCVYYARARTEERHLSRDPTYVAYALWINEHGLLRRLARVLPWLRYRESSPAPPDAKIRLQCREELKR
jgi:protein-S-isoprenylcysteine O-methyltransferase Ste14